MMTDFIDASDVVDRMVRLVDCKEERVSGRGEIGDELLIVRVGGVDWKNGCSGGGDDNFRKRHGAAQRIAGEKVGNQRVRVRAGLRKGGTAFRRGRGRSNEQEQEEGEKSE